MLERAIRAAICAVAAASAFAAAPACAQASEDAVKAAFLPEFARYVELPGASAPASGKPYYLCIIGRDPFGALVDRAAASETINGRSVAVRRFVNADAPAVSGCHIAYVGGTDPQTAQTLAALRRQPTLTVTDARWGKQRGMVHFVVTDGRVRFHIDNKAAAARGIAISSRLLALAVDVKQGGR